MGDLTVFTQNGTQSAVTKWTENTDRGDIWIQVPGIDLKLDPQTKVHPYYIYTCINMNRIYSVFLNFLCYETHEYIFQVLGTFGFQILFTAKKNGNAADIAVDLFELWPYPC